MRLNTNTASRNVVHHAAHANCAVLCGHSADRIVAATKRLLGRKRLSDPSLYKPVPSKAMSPSSDMSMSEPGQQSRQQTGGLRPGVQAFAETTWHPQAGDTPAPVWAALVITRALSS
jgi:hypothetical protein